MYSFTIYGKSLSIRYLTIDMLRTAYVPALMSSHRVRKSMAMTLKTISSNAFPSTKVFEFRLNSHLSLFLGVKMTIIRHWIR